MVSFLGSPSYLHKKRSRILLQGSGFFFVRLQQVTELLTQAKFFNDVTVTFDVTAL